MLLVTIVLMLPLLAPLAAQATVIAAGKAHTVALKGDGTVCAWGDNAFGQLGDGATANSSTPVQVSGVIGVTAIAASYYHTVALKGDGTVWAWGYNNSGQLGDGTSTNSSTPLQVSGLTGVTAIATGQLHSVALKGDGTVWAWGENSSGQLGNGTTATSSTPVQVSGLNGVTAIAAGFTHTLALKGDGTLWAWGENVSGQLGNGLTTNSSTPVQVSGVTGISAIAAGQFYSMALIGDGTLWAWGDNSSGQLGNGLTTNSFTPVQVNGVTGVTAIAAGELHAVALIGNGTLWAWGDNVSGQLGNGLTTSSSTPVQVSGLTGVTAIAAGSYHAVALKSDGTVWAWGKNDSGQLGDGTASTRTTPVQVTGVMVVSLPAHGHILDANTVALWRMNETSSSANAVDETGNYTLTQFGNPDVVTGRIGNGRLLDGATKYFQKAGDADFGAAMNGDWTYEGWVYLNPAFSVGGTLFVYNGLAFSFNQPDTILASIGISADRKIFWQQSQNTSSLTEISSNAVLDTGKYYHIAVSRTAQGGNLFTYRMYVNGVIDTTSTDVAGISYSVSGASHYIGLGNYTDISGFGVGSSVLNARLDDTRISKVARSATEIFESYQRAVTLTVTDTTPPIDGVIATTPGNGQVALSWTAATDNVGVTGYKLVYATGVTPPSDCNGGTVLYSGTNISYSHTGLASGTQHAYRVCATDAAGNWSAGATANAMTGRACVTAPSGLIGWWKGEGNGNDQLGPHNGTLNSVAFAPGKIGQAFSLNSNGYVDLNVPAIDTTLGHNVTVTFWMYWNGGNYNEPIGFPQYCLYLRDGGFGFNTNHGEVYGISSTGLSNRWVYVTAVFNNGSTTSSQLYIDGVLQSLSARLGSIYNGASVDAHFQIGGQPGYDTTQYLFGGSLDEVQMYNRALNATEVQSIYDAGSNGVCAPTYPVFYNGNGSTGGTVPSDGTSYAQYATVTVQANIGILVKAGYAFAGWNTAADGSGIAYAGGDTFSMGLANVTLYAQWVSLPLPTDGVLTTTPGNGQIALSWTAATDNVGVTGYKLVYAAGATPPADCNGGTALYSGINLSYSHAGLDSGATYSYRVCATDAAGYWSLGATANAITGEICVAPSGLVAWLPFDGTANDASGNGNNGIAVGATLANDRFGNSNASYTFNGYSNYIQLSESKSLDIGTADFTVSAWIKTTTQQGRIFSKGSYGCTPGYMVRTGGGRAFFEVSGVSGQGCIVGIGGQKNVADNEWHLVSAVLKRDSGAQIYVDGVLDAQNSVVTTGVDVTNANNPRIGMDDQSGNEPFGGSIDDVLVYNRALTADEIVNIYNARANSVCTNPYTLTVTKSGSGAGTVNSVPSGISCGGTCSTDFVNGATVTLTVTPDLWSIFTGWGDACSGTGTCTVTVSSAASVTATFDQDPLYPHIDQKIFPNIVANNQPFTFLLTSQGGTPGYTYSITDPPSWLTLSSSGMLTLTNVPNGQYSFTVTVEDSASPTKKSTSSIFTFTSSGAFPPVRFVAPSGSSTGNCDSWGAACDLQYALSLIPSDVEGTQVWAKAGTYKPAVSGDRNATFTLKNGVAIYGGFAGTETNLPQRDFKVNLTILSGDLNGDDNTTVTYTDINRIENAYHVVTGSGTDYSAVLDGFTITGGHANTESHDNGGTNVGGGIFNNGGSPTLKNLIITGNTAYSGGAGVGNFNSSSPIMTNITIAGNISNYDGGGIMNWEGSGSDPIISGMTISGNQALHGNGGGMYNKNSLPPLTNVTIAGNSAPVGNGGGIYNDGIGPILKHVTLTGNSAQAGGGIYNYNAGGTILTSSILWGNSAATGANYYQVGAVMTVTYSVIQDGYTGDRNISADPNLGTLGNYGGFTQTIPLLSGSSAIDAASAAACPATDQRGVARPSGSGCDIGAYEFVANATTFIITSTAGVNGTISPAGETAVVFGTNQTYTITPAAGYKVTDVLVDGLSVGAVTGYSFTAVSGNHSISATFAMQTTFNTTTDFSVTTNPNGVWSYGWMPVGFGQLNLYTSNNGVNWWLGNIGGDGTPAIGKNTGTGYANGIPPGWLSLHPGPGTQPSVLRFTAPFSGTIHITGQFLPGDGGFMQVAVRVNGQQQFQAGDSGSFDLTSMVAAGDTVDFTVYGAYYSGNTPIDATITYTFIGLGVASTSPAQDASGVGVGSSITATFSEPIVVASINTTTFSLGTGVTGTVTYNAETYTATFTPDVPLAVNTRYAVTIKGGADGVADHAGNVLASDYTWSFTTGASSCTAPPGGMLTWWPGNGNTNDEISGFNGTSVGNVTFAPGKVGQAFSFDGNGYVESLINIPENNFTLSAWTKTVHPGGVFSVVSSNGNDRHMYVNGQGYACFRVYNGSGWCTSRKVDDDSWHQWTLTVEDGVGQKAYIDGVPAGTNPYDHSDFTWQDRIVIGYSADGGYFNGLIDEVQIFNRPLNPVEIAAIFAEGSGGVCTAPTLPNISAVSPSTAFGAADICGSAAEPVTVTVTNTGLANLTIGTIASDNSQFAILNDGCSGQSIAAGAVCTLQVKFSPTHVDWQTATVSIPSNAPTQPTVKLGLTGYGSYPVVTASAPSLSFAEVQGGTPVSQELTLSSNNSACTGSWSAGSGASWLQLSQTTGTGSAGTVTASINASGLQGGVYSTNLYFNGTTTIGQGLAGWSIPVTFTVQSPNISANPLSLNFISKVTNSSYSQVVTIRNSGASVLHVTATTFGGDNAADFSVQSNSCADAVGIGGACTVAVVFIPTTAGTKNATLLIAADDPDTPSLSVQLTGIGRTTRAAAQAGLDFLIPATKAWAGGSCNGCHVQAQTVVAMAIGRTHQYSIATADINQIMGTMMGAWRGWESSGAFSNNGGQPLTTTQFGGHALAVYDELLTNGADTALPAYSSNLVTTADWLYSQRQGDGHIIQDHYEPPIDQSDIMATANAISVWKQAFARTSNTKYQEAINAATAWLRSQVAPVLATPGSYFTQDKTYIVLGLWWSGATESDTDIQNIKALLLTEQQSDGSWKLTNGVSGGTAYATGQVLFALKQVGLGDADTAVLSGTNWLINNQGADGSWQPLNWLGGRPSDIAASMWAVLGLVSYDVISVNIVAPSDGSRLQKGNNTITADATTNQTGGAITGMQLFVDNIMITSSTGAAVSFPWDTTTVADGYHDIKVVATDDKGGTGSRAIRVITGNMLIGSVSVNPNPFDQLAGGSTTISYSLISPPGINMDVTVDILDSVNNGGQDIPGKLVRNLLSAASPLPYGNYRQVWDGKDAASTLVNDGFYFARITATTVESVPVTQVVYEKIGAYNVAHIATISGVITNQQDGTPVANALIQALKGGAEISSTRSTASGFYRINLLLPDTYDLRVTAPGFRAALSPTGISVDGGVDGADKKIGLNVTGQNFPLKADQYTPVIAPLANISINEGASQQVTVMVTDGDGDITAITASGLPAFATLVDNNNNTATITLAPGPNSYRPTPYAITVKADDGMLSSSIVFTVTVNDATPPTTGSLKATAVSTTQVNLSWYGFTDSGSGMASDNTYKLVVTPGTTPPAGCNDGSSAVLYMGAETVFSQILAAPLTQYAYRICAYDAAGNVSSAITAVSPSSSPLLTITESGSVVGSVTANSGTLEWNGRIGTANYPFGTVVTLTASAGAGALFTGWDGACSGTAPTCMLTIAADTAVTALFNTNDFVQGLGASSLVAKLVTDSAITVISGSETLKGPLTATASYTGMSGGTLGDGTRLTLGNGIFLSNGHGLPTNSTSENGSFAASQGDADLKAVLDTAGYTAVKVTGVSALSFDFTVPAGVTSVNLDFIFASQEYYTSKWDIAGVFIDGVNYAKLPNGQILRITPVAQLNYYTSPLLPEWQSWAAPQTVVGLLDLSRTTHTIKMAVADTDDQLVPTGLFLASLRTGAQTQGGGIIPISGSTVSPPVAVAGTAGQTFTFTYAAASGGMNNGELDITVPAGWSGGSVTSSTGTPALTEGVIKITGVTLAEGAAITVTYADVTVGTTVGANTFATTVKSTLDGAPALLANSPAVAVKINSTTALVSSVGNSSINGQPVVFTATVTSSSGVPAGTVTFQDGANILESVTLINGTAAYSTTSLIPGIHTITATYGGDATTIRSGNTLTITILTANKVTPTITWSAPGDIPYGTALSDAQLNAASGGVAGTFNYFPSGGTVLNAGTAQSLTVSFTPSDTVTYNTPTPVTVAINVTVANQTISFGIAPTLVYGGASGSVTAVAGSGLPLTFSSLTGDVCTVSGSTVTPRSVGTCIIAANQGGNGNYNAAAQVTQTLVIDVDTAAPVISAFTVPVTAATPLGSGDLGYRNR